MPFEEKIENVYETVLNQIERLGKGITKDSKKELLYEDLVGELGFSDDEINFLLHKKRLLVKYKNELDSTCIQDMIFEMPSDYYFKTLLSKEKVKQLKRLEELEKL